MPRMAQASSAPRSWSRRHVNGMDAIVLQAPVRKDLYSVGAMARDSAVTLTVVRGSLAEAQRVADDLAGCAPCECPPWA